LTNHGRILTNSNDYFINNLFFLEKDDYEREKKYLPKLEFYDFKKTLN